MSRQGTFSQDPNTPVVQGPILVVSNGEGSTLVRAVAKARMFPLVGTGWQDAAEAIARVQPTAVIVAAGSGGGDLAGLLTDLARQIERLQPLVPLIVLDPVGSLPPNAIPFTQTSTDPARLTARLNAALRVRALHATVLRRSGNARSMAGYGSSPGHLPDNDPLRDATALLIGRGPQYPALSVALGERMGVIGALSIEAAAKHLNARDLDGIVLGDGFSTRVIDAFLMVLSEDTRFRNLPVILAGESDLARSYRLPNLEVASGTPVEIAVNAVPLIRQNAFEARLRRALKSIDAGGLLDPLTGLLTQDAFARDLSDAVSEALTRGAALSAANFAFPVKRERLRLDAARILSRLMRRMDFATLRDDGSIIVVFAGADLRSARMIARRIASVLKQTTITGKRDGRLDPIVSCATLLEQDSAETFLARLQQADQRRAS